MAALKEIGNYKLIRQLGEGGMGSVYLATSKAFAEPVAIKLIRSEVLAKPSIVSRFHREITLCKQFAHPYVIKILDGGVDEESKIPFLVMENLEGSSLMDLLKKSVIKPERALHIFLHLAEALSYVHPLGIIHRDIKPDNVFIVSDDRTVLLDFGLAYIEVGTRLSATNDCIGTLPLMSPEQLRAQKVEETSDIYNLGMTMYYALTCEIPYTMDDIALICARKKVLKPPTPHVLNKKVPPILSKIVMKCIEVDKKLRFQNADELKTVLSEVVANLNGLGKAGNKTALTSISKVESAGKRLDKRRPSGKGGSHDKGPTSGKGRTSGKGGSPEKPQAVRDFETGNNGPVKSSGRGSPPSTIGKSLQKAFLALVALGAIFFIASYYLFPPSGGMSVDAPWKVVNDRGDALVELTEKQDCSNLDAEAVVLWMRSVDELFESVHKFREGNRSQLQKLNFSSTNRRIREILKGSPLISYLDGEVERFQGKGIEAAVLYRNSISHLLKNMFIQKEKYRLTNPLATYIVSKIGDTLSASGRKNIYICSLKENRLWQNFLVNLPVTEILSEEVYFLRCWIFLSSGLALLDDKIVSLDFDLIAPACSVILHTNRTRALPEGSQLFLKGLFAAREIEPPGVFEMEAQPYKKLRTINSAYSTHISVLMITEEQLLKMKNMKTEYRKFHWLFLARLLVSSDINWSQSRSLFGVMRTIEKDIRCPRLNARVEAAAYERLRRIRSTMAIFSPETTVSDRLKYEALSLQYSMAALTRISKGLTTEQAEDWRCLGLLYEKDKFFSKCIKAMADKSRDDPEKLVSAIVSAFDGLVSDAGLSISPAVVYHHMKIFRLATFMLGEFLVKKWPGKFDLTPLRKIPKTADIFEAHFKKVAGDGPVPKHPYAEISNAEIVASFILRLYEEGATTRDWKRLTKSLEGMFGDPLGAYSLWMRPKSKQPPVPPEPWTPPKQR